MLLTWRLQNQTKFATWVVKVHSDSFVITKKARFSRVRHNVGCTMGRHFGRKTFTFDQKWVKLNRIVAWNL